MGQSYRDPAGGSRHIDPETAKLIERAEREFARTAGHLDDLDFRRQLDRMNGIYEEEFDPDRLKVSTHS